MEKHEEQQAAGASVDPKLVVDVIILTRDVNVNLGHILARTDTVIRRQNLLTVLFIFALGLMTAQLVLGFSQQRLQESAKAQLFAMDRGRDETRSDLKAARTQAHELKDAVEAIKLQLQAVPTVTSDKAGRLSLEVPVTDDKKVSGDPAPSTEKVVIPLKPSQSRLER